VHALVAVVAHQQVLGFLTLTAAEEEEVRGRRKGRGRRSNSPFITDYALQALQSLQVQLPWRGSTHLKPPILLILDSMWFSSQISLCLSMLPSS